MSFTTCLLVMIGGAIGTLARYLISTVALPFSQNLPWGTIGINILGSFIIGLFGTLTLAHGRYPFSENARLFVMVGLCGGFTTFSAFSSQRRGPPGRHQHRRIGDLVHRRGCSWSPYSRVFQRRCYSDRPNCY
jgi:protein CrcB